MLMEMKKPRKKQISGIIILKIIEVIVITIII